MSLSIEDSPLKKRYKSKRDLIWEYYTFYKEIDKYTCNECQDEYSKTSTTVCLREHLLRKHRSLSDKYLLDQSLLEKSPLTKQYVEKKERKDKEIEKKFANALSVPSFSINTFLNPNVRSFLQSMNPTFPIPKSHGGLKSILLETHNKTMENIKLFLKSCLNTPSITLDIWSDPGLRHAYLGVTLHVVDSFEKQLKRIFLGLMSLSGKHTHDLIKKESENILKLYSLTLDNVFKIITDNGANVVKAFKEEETDSSSEDEDIYLVVEDLDLDNFNTENQDNLNTLFPKRASCFAHSLQLVVMEFINQYVKNLPAFDILNTVVKKIKYSVLLKQELQKLTKKTVISVSLTRWGSYIEVIERYIELEKELKILSEKFKWSTFSTSEDYFYFKEVHKLLKPFSDILKKIQAEKTVTISFCYVYLKILQKMLNDKESFSALVNEIEYLKNKLFKRFSYIFDFNDYNFDPIYIVSSALDPNTINLLSEKELDFVKLSLKRFLPCNVVHDELIADPNFTENSQTCSLYSYIDLLMDDHDKRKQSQIFKTSNNIDSCLEYISNARFSLNNQTDCIKFWCQIKNDEWILIKKLSFKLFAIPATSAPIERVFSQAGLATHRHRNRTKINLLNSQLINYLNPDFI